MPFIRFGEWLNSDRFIEVVLYAMMIVCGLLAVFSLAMAFMTAVK